MPKHIKGKIEEYSIGRKAKFTEEATDISFVSTVALSLPFAVKKHWKIEAAKESHEHDKSVNKRRLCAPVRRAFSLLRPPKFRIPINRSKSNVIYRAITHAC